MEPGPHCPGSRAGRRPPLHRQSPAHSSRPALAHSVSSLRPGPPVSLHSPLRHPPPRFPPPLNPISSGGARARLPALRRRSAAAPLPPRPPCWAASSSAAAAACDRGREAGRRRREREEGRQGGGPPRTHAHAGKEGCPLPVEARPEEHLLAAGSEAAAGASRPAARAGPPRSLPPQDAQRRSSRRSGAGGYGAAVTGLRAFSRRPSAQHRRRGRR